MAALHPLYTIADFLYAVPGEPSFSLKHGLYQRFLPRDFYETWHFATRCRLAQLPSGHQPADRILILRQTRIYVRDFLSSHFALVPADPYRVNLLLPTFTVFSFPPTHLVTDVVLGVNFVLLDCFPRS